MRKHRACAVLAVLVLAVGCKEVSKDNVNLFHAASMAAKERAVAFKAITPLLAPKDVAGTKDFKRWVSAHQEGVTALYRDLTHGEALPEGW